MKYKEQNDRVKQIIIDLATEAQYGNPEYTNMNEIDYKFWEDCEHKDSVIILAQMLDKERTDQKVREHIDSVLPDEPDMPTIKRCLNIAKGCFDYRGGHHNEKELSIYYHGIQTVVNCLDAFHKKIGEDNLQLNVVENVGSKC